MAKTWLKLLPEIHIYTDELKNESVESIVNSTNHLNIHFHLTPTFTRYMVGSQWDNKWNSVQNRHLYALGDTYYRMPNKTWYFLGDDDTFAYANMIPEYLSKKDPDEMKIFGQCYLVFTHLNKLFRNETEEHFFAQGGAGLVIPGVLMKKLAPKMTNCTQIYSSANFPSDIRLAACLEHFFNFTILPNENGVFISDPGIFNGDTPMKSNLRPKTPPVTYHHIVPPLIDQIWHAGYTEWTDLKDVDWYIDWSNITMTNIFIEIGVEGLFMELQWGFKVYIEGRFNESYSCISQPEPIFDPLDKEHINPKEFVQEFEGNITFRYICDDELEPNEIEFDSFLSGGYDGSVLRIACPSPRPYPVNHPGKTSPIIITKSNVTEY